MLGAVTDAGAAPEDITYINAHGTATHHNDLFETRATRLAFGEHAKVYQDQLDKAYGRAFARRGGRSRVCCLREELEEGYIHRTVGLAESEGGNGLKLPQGEQQRGHSLCA